MARLVSLIMAMAAVAPGTAVPVLLVSATPAVAQSGVPARAGRCLRWNRVIDKQGYYDSSRVEVTNSCVQAVTGWQCVIAGYAPNAGGCDPRFGTYGKVTYAPAQTRRIGMASNARAIVDVLECPAGLKPTRPVECGR